MFIPTSIFWKKREDWEIKTLSKISNHFTKFCIAKIIKSAWLIQKSAEIMKHLLMSHRQRWLSNSDAFSQTMTFWKKKNVMVKKQKMWYFIVNHDTFEKKRHGWWKWLITENLTFFGPTMTFFMILTYKSFDKINFVKIHNFD